MMTDLKIPSFQAGPAWMITAQSYLMDRIEPECARVQIPARTVKGGVLSFGRGPMGAAKDAVKRRGLNAMRRPAVEQVTHPNTIDLRRNTPSNWAHFLNNHLPILFKICDEMGLSPADTCLVLPEQTPKYITRAADMFGLTVQLTDAVLNGDGIVFDVTPWTGIRPDRHQWVRSPLVKSLLDTFDTTEGSPKRVFLSRKDTRAATNEAELETNLAKKGFTKVYPEDLSPKDQMALFRNAEVMVAIHGAGLAPLLYAQPDGQLTHLIEILHAGHMTDVYRVMAEQVGVSWTGVQGRLKPAYIEQAYSFDTSFKEHSLDNFYVDLRALDVAFETAGLA